VGFLLLFDHVQIFQGQRISPVGKLSFKRIA